MDDYHIMTSSSGSDRSRSSSVIVRRSIGQTFIQTTITIVVIALIMFAVIDAWTSRDVADWLVSWIDLIENHLLYGIFVVIFLYIVGSIFFIPQSVLSVAVGYAYGQAFPNMPMLSIPLASCVSFYINIWKKNSVGIYLALTNNDNSLSQNPPKKISRHF